jgi:prepilin-type N-terminal cleavage/methylation domain-containing protein
MSPVQVCGKKNSQAFTLIELLVVIGLIAILVAVTLTIIPKVKRAVYGAQTQSQLAALATAIQAYYNDYRAYPGPLANNQLYAKYDNSSGPYILANTGGSSLTPVQLTAGEPFTGNAIGYNPPSGSYLTGRVTGSQNLVLGLLGGLEVQANGSGVVSQFVYNPLDLLATDGVTPNPRGPASLNPASPKRQSAYIQVKAGDISVPTESAFNGNGTSFIDEGGRFADDTMIPVFLDKFNPPMPILYYRTNVGGTAIAALRSTSSAGAYVDDSNNVLTDPNTNANLVPQYDLTQNLPYAQSQIGLVKSSASAQGGIATHGLQGVGTSPALTDPIDTNVNGTFVPYNNGKNGLAYFKDPSLNTANSSNTNGQGIARQKDGFVLISAGPDRQYGTRDDLIYPGPLQP